MWTRFPRRIAPIVAGLALAVAGASIALAQAPLPNSLVPLPPDGNPLFAPVPGANLAANGTAAKTHGDPGRGRVLFAANCASCHGDRGTMGITNPGSDDGVVPALNPIDPGFIADSQGDPAQFARALDLFLQHGSRPAGDDPTYSMIPWGDHKFLSQPDIADVEAYVMQLNGVYWVDKWYPPAEVRMEATRGGDIITYKITVVNHGSSLLGNLILRDTLPPGLAYVTSYIPDPGANPGSFTGSTVEWQNQDGVPQGGTLGPFIIVTRLYGKTVPPNVAEVGFTFDTWDGNDHPGKAVSDRVVPRGTTAPSARATPSPIAGPSATPAASPTAGVTAQADSPDKAVVLSGGEVSGHLDAGGDGHFAYYKFTYPGNQSIDAINLQVSPDDSAVLSNAGFQVYGPQKGKVYAAGGAQQGMVPNVSGNLIAGDAGTYLIQVYNYDPNLPIDFKLTLGISPPDRS